MAYQKQHIHIIRTGGTIDFIDPAYDELDTKLMKIKRDASDYLKHIARPYDNYSIEELWQKDSRDINDADRLQLVNSIRDASSDKIIVTHGTYTMNTTGKFLKKYKELENKTIILTGSMLPLWGFMTSDAGFNLGFAMASVRYLKPGIYISLNGENFDPVDVHKNLDAMKFEPHVEPSALDIDGSEIQ
jgi:L-asparaginase